MQEQVVSSGPIIAGLMFHAWIDLATVLISLLLSFRVRGGQITYPILLIGVTGLVGFVTQVTGGAEVTWVMTTIKSLVLLLVAASFWQILKP